MAIKKIRYVEIPNNTLFEWAGLSLRKENSRRAFVDGNKTKSFIFNGGEIVQIEIPDVPDDDDLDGYFPYYYYYFNIP